MTTIFLDHEHPARPHVLRDSRGGVLFRYRAFHSGDVSCEFSLFCEVGEPYQAAFDPLFKQYRLADEAVNYTRRPWIADKLEKR